MIVEGFNRDITTVLAQVCADAYDGNLMSHWVGQLSIDSVVHFEQQSTEGYILLGADMTILVFVGTNELSDWLTNLQVPLRYSWDALMVDGKGQVHEGFQDSFDSIRPQLQELLEEAVEDNNSPLWITGHSLGGALASIAALSFASHTLLSPAGVVTFGSPRIGDKDLQQTFADTIENHFRIEVAGDVVPHIPPWFSGYRHVGRLVYIESNGKLRSKPRWWSRLLASARALWRGDKSRGHKILAYLSALKEKP